jgi:hypothetical protein
MAQMTEMKVTNEKPPGTPLEVDDVKSTIGESAANGAPAAPIAEQLTDLGETVGFVRCEDPYVVAENVDVFYGDNHAIKDVTLEISNFPALPESHERFDRVRSRHRQHLAWR